MLPRALNLSADENNGRACYCELLESDSSMTARDFMQIKECDVSTKQWTI